MLGDNKSTYNTLLADPFAVIYWSISKTKHIITTAMVDLVGVGVIRILIGALVVEN